MKTNLKNKQEKKTQAPQEKPTIGLVDRIVHGLNEWRRLTDALDQVLVGNIAATVPWLASFIPASIAFDHMVNVLHFHPVIAFVGAVVVEFLGVATITTTFQLWDYNDTKRKSDGNAPVLVALGTAVFYMLVVLIVNVMLDNSDSMSKLSKGLLSSLSIIGAITLAVRSQHARRLADIEEEKAEKQRERERSQKEKLEQVSGNLPENSNEKGETFQKVTGTFTDWRKVPPSERLKMAALTEDEIEETYKLSGKTAGNWYRNLLSDQGQAGEVARFHHQQRLERLGDQP